MLICSPPYHGETRGTRERPLEHQKLREDEVQVVCHWFRTNVSLSLPHFPEVPIPGLCPTLDYLATLPVSFSVSLPHSVFTSALSFFLIKSAGSRNLSVRVSSIFLTPFFRLVTLCCSSPCLHLRILVVAYASQSPLSLSSVSLSFFFLSADCLQSLRLLRWRHPEKRPRAQRAATPRPCRRRRRYGPRKRQSERQTLSQKWQT